MIWINAPGIPRDKENADGKRRTYPAVSSVFDDDDLGVVGALDDERPYPILRQGLKQRVLVRGCRAVQAQVRFVAANPGVPRVLFHELQYPGDSPVRAEVRATIAAYRKRFGRLFAQAKAAGELPCDLDTALAPVLFIGAVQGLVIDSALAGDEAEMVKRARRLFPLLVHGYRGRRKP